MAARCIAFGEGYIYPQTSSDLDVRVVYMRNTPGSHGSYNIYTDREQDADLVKFLFLYHRKFDCKM